MILLLFLLLVFDFFCYSSCWLYFCVCILTSISAELLCWFCSAAICWTRLGFLISPVFVVFLVVSCLWNWLFFLYCCLLFFTSVLDDLFSYFVLLINVGFFCVWFFSVFILVLAGICFQVKLVYVYHWCHYFYPFLLVFFGLFFCLCIYPMIQKLLSFMGVFFPVVLEGGCCCSQSFYVRHWDLFFSSYVTIKISRFCFYTFFVSIRHTVLFLPIFCVLCGVYRHMFLWVIISFLSLLLIFFFVYRCWYWLVLLFWFYFSAIRHMLFYLMFLCVWCDVGELLLINSMLFHLSIMTLIFVFYSYTYIGVDLFHFTAFVYMLFLDSVVSTYFAFFNVFLMRGYCCGRCFFVCRFWNWFWCFSLYIIISIICFHCYVFLSYTSGQCFIWWFSVLAVLLAGSCCCSPLFSSFTDFTAFTDFTVLLNIFSLDVFFIVLVLVLELNYLFMCYVFVKGHFPFLLNTFFPYISSYINSEVILRLTFIYIYISVCTTISYCCILFNISNWTIIYFKITKIIVHTHIWLYFGNMTSEQLHRFIPCCILDTIKTEIKLIRL